MLKEIEYVHAKMYYVRFYMHSSSYETLRYHVYLMCHYQIIVHKHYVAIRAKFKEYNKQVVSKTINIRVIT